MIDVRPWSLLGASCLVLFGLSAVGFVKSASAQTPENSEFRAGVLDGTTVNPMVVAPPGTAATVHFYWIDPDDESSGFQLSISLEGNLTVLPDFTIEGTALELIGAEFVDADIDNDDFAIDGDGRELTVGILLDSFPPFDNQVAGPAPVPFELGRVSILTPSTLGDCGTVEFVDGLNGPNGPALSNIVIVNTQSMQNFTTVGAVVCAVGTAFVRSDCNDDGNTDVGDMVYLLNFLFQSGALPPCLEACEANADGALDLADALTIGNFLFSMGPPPPAPFPDCGSVMGTPDCDTFGGC